MPSQTTLQHIAKILKKNNMRIAVAESCTGGLIAYWLTKIPGSSKYFSLGIIPYQLPQKYKLLKINKELLNKHQGVSSEVARKMAKNIKKIAGADIGISTTGFAGPAGEKNIPIGTVYIGISLSKKTSVYKFRFKGGRQTIRKKTLLKTLDILRKILDTL